MKRLFAVLTLSVLGLGAVGCAGGSVSARYQRGYYNRSHHPGYQVRRECYEDRWGDVYCRDVRYRRY